MLRFGIGWVLLGCLLAADAGRAVQPEHTLASGDPPVNANDLPTVVTLDPIQVTSDLAVFRGDLISTGGAETVVWFAWGPTDGEAGGFWWYRTAATPAGVGQFSATVSHLRPLTKYYYRACAVNSAGITTAPSTASFNTTISTNGLVQIALNRAEAQVNDTMTNAPPDPDGLTVRVYPLWETASPKGDAMASSGTVSCPDLLAGEATNAIPDSLWGDAHEAARRCMWSLVTSNDQGKAVVLGRVAYFVVNCSGLLDANCAGGSNRVDSTSIAEIDLSGMPDIRSATNFYLNRAQYGPYSSVADLTAKSKQNDALNLPVKNLFADSFDPGRDVYFRTYSSGEPVGIGTTTADLRPKFSINEITNYTPDANGQYGDFAVNQKDGTKTFKKDYFDPLVQLLLAAGLGWATPAKPLGKASDIAWNIVNWIDMDRLPAWDTSLASYLHTEGGEAMPYINEIMLKQGAAPNTCQFSVEIWWPFYPQEPNARCEDGMYEIEIQTCPTNPADPNAPGPPTALMVPLGAMTYGTPSEFKQFESVPIAGTAAWIRVYTHYWDPVSGSNVVVDGAMDRRGTGGYPPEELVFVRFTSSVNISRQVSDPRCNGKIWYWRYAQETLGRINENPDLDLDPAISSSAMKDKPVCDPWWLINDVEIGHVMPLRQGLPIHAGNRPMRNIGELGYIFLSNRENATPAQPQEKWFWSTIDLMDFREGAYLADHCTVRSTNTVAHGLVNVSTRQHQVLRSLFYKMPLRDPTAGLPMEIDANRATILVDTITQMSERRPFISFQDIFNPKYQGDLIGTEFKRCAVKTLANFDPAALPNDKVLEDPFRNILDLITFRQNMFTFILAAQEFAPDGATVTNEERAVAVVFRDAYTGAYTTNSFEPIPGGLAKSKLMVTLPERATEGDGVLPQAGMVSVFHAPDTPLSVALTPSHPGEIAVPPLVAIGSGQTSAVFDVTILDDPDPDGNRTVTLMATDVTSIPRYEPAVKSIVVVDNDSYRLSATCSVHGTIAPSGEVVVVTGGATSFVVRAEPFYHIETVETNGVRIGGAAGLSEYTLAWSNVLRDGTITATFSVNVTANGTPEWWLAGHGLTNADWESEAAGDQDGDGMANWKECRADTDPTNPASLLRLTGIERRGHEVAIRWMGGNEATQVLEAADYLWPTGGWWNLLTKPPPTGITNEFLHPGGTQSSSRYFRVRATR